MHLSTKTNTSRWFPPNRTPPLKIPWLREEEEEEDDDDDDYDLRFTMIQFYFLTLATDFLRLNTGLIQSLF